MFKSVNIKNIYIMSYNHYCFILQTPNLQIINILLEHSIRVVCLELFPLYLCNHMSSCMDVGAFLCQSPIKLIWNSQRIKTIASPIHPLPQYESENILCNVTPFFYHYSVVIQHLVSDRQLSLISKENVHNVR
jgi:hypothetical protein